MDLYQQPVARIFNAVWSELDDDIQYVRNVLSGIDAPIDLLDVGCGDGRLMRGLSGERLRGIGIDDSIIQIEAASSFLSDMPERTRSSWSFKVCDFRFFESKYLFDAICCIGLTAPLLEANGYSDLFQVASRCLKPNGLLIFDYLEPLMDSTKFSYAIGLDSVGRGSSGHLSIECTHDVKQRIQTTLIRNCKHGQHESDIVGRIVCQLIDHKSLDSLSALNGFKLESFSRIHSQANKLENSRLPVVNCAVFRRTDTA